ncbi:MULTISPECIES: kinase/pyrophosphorylase [Atopobiaceae]|uniref:Kinase/pyrophosphorylase n=1 Tax=Parafannyhessea umbonata TaxID=604330 RepID=A0A1H9NTP3_9ACTN|nr:MULTISPECIES: kinase/pyrophosphorylase [Atopobiaceae]SEH57672.1 hypothetical protein SAMN05216447_10625 [Parafannyhessea umbonata]SER39271.1 hypothetical protein SAMN05216446_0570 [Parafannyhessea umbonata]SJZ50808.1 hypothetical protein SAMN06298223_0518 [Olsenella sp. KH1P3]
MTDAATDEELFNAAAPVVIVISDACGKTATGVVEAAADQFGADSVVIKRLSNVKTVDTVCEFLNGNIEEDVPLAVFHTIVERNLRRDIRRELDKRGIPSIDLLGPAITVISTLTGEEPKYEPGRRMDTEVQEV